jgi:hypothetical protein
MGKWSGGRQAWSVIDDIHSHIRWLRYVDPEIIA